MNPNENTPNMGPVNSNSVNNPMPNEPQEGSSNTWKYVTIGGAAALLVGAGTVYATDAFGARTAIFGGDDAAGTDASVDQLGQAIAPEVKAETTETADGSEMAKDTEPAADASAAAAPSAGIAVEIYDHAPVAHVGQHLSFADAFASARAQVGPGGVFHWHGHDYGTYYETEWDAMSDAQQAQYEASAASPAHVTHPVTPHYVAEAPVAVVSDGMSFADAFAAARAQVGAGGVFEWHGGVFSTYYENEWDSMTPQQQHYFTAQVHTEHVPQHTHYYADADGGVHFKSVETFGTEQYDYDDVTVKVMDDDDSGTLTTIQEVEASDGDIHIDVASDGQTAFVDVENDGIVDMTFTPLDGSEPNPFDGAPLTDDGSMIL